MFKDAPMAMRSRVLLETCRSPGGLGDFEGHGLGGAPQALTVTHQRLSLSQDRSAHLLPVSHSPTFFHPRRNQAEEESEGARKEDTDNLLGSP